LVAAGAGGLAGLGTAVKLTMVLVAAGLAVAAAAAWWRRWRWLAVIGGGLATGFAVIVAASLAPWGFATLRPALRAGSFVSIGSPWRLVRDGLQHGAGLAVGAADDVVKAGAIVLAAVLLVLLLRWLRGPAGVGRAELGGTGPDRLGPAGTGMGLPGVAACCVFAFAFAWLVAWPYVLPWYDGLGWAVLALLPLSAASDAVVPVPNAAVPVPASTVAALDWLLLVRTAALAFGYLPARGIIMPADLRWLQSVVRTGVTPVILLGVTVGLVVLVVRRAAERRLAS
jgi:hypothetical protein